MRWSVPLCLALLAAACGEFEQAAAACWFIRAVRVACPAFEFAIAPATHNCPAPGTRSPQPHFLILPACMHALPCPTRSCLPTAAGGAAAQTPPCAVGKNNCIACSENIFGGPAAFCVGCSPGFSLVPAQLVCKGDNCSYEGGTCVKVSWSCIACARVCV